MLVDLLVLALAGTATALATGLGAVPVFVFRRRAAALRPLLWGLAAGLMAVASVVGLLEPALDEGSAATVGAGLLAGIAFLLVSRRLLAHRDVQVGALRGAGVRRSLLPFSFAFAAGAMLALVALELVPQAFTATTWRPALAGAATGAAAMLALSAAIGV